MAFLKQNMHKKVGPFDFRHVHFPLKMGISPQLFTEFLSVVVLLRGQPRFSHHNPQLGTLLALLSIFLRFFQKRPI